MFIANPRLREIAGHLFSRDPARDAEAIKRMVQEASALRAAPPQRARALPDHSPIDVAAVYAVRNRIHDGARAGVYRPDDIRPLPPRRLPQTLAEVAADFWSNHKEATK